MDHAFELAFDLCDEAAGRIRHQRYGVTRIVLHNHGEVLLTAVHGDTPETRQQLILLAHDEYGQLAAVEATAAHAEARPCARIVKVRAGQLTFHAVPGEPWTWRAAAGAHTYTLTAELDEPMWTTTVNDAAPVAYDDLDDAVADLLEHAADTAAA
ncbi:hypothetical protein F0Q45_11130 [Mycobacterium simiae]|uniref:Uncharacterized protein n=1 Tax=Mycobacterium simiae TaxID=1784 RepID=A0A5B1BSF8_MYCSI|nr:hypothetical protein [Mycobacterium simiae]KAA1250184.1 hypothetical protein F0Q45_11130 [Mycobacterium simiae]